MSAKKIFKIAMPYTVINPIIKLCNHCTENNYLYILLFHHVKENQLEKFRKIFDYIKKYFDIISPETIELYLNGNLRNKKKKILFTFDDGFVSDLAVVKEILNPEGIKTIFFVCPNFIGLKGGQAIKFASDHLYEIPKAVLDVDKEIKPMDWSDIHYLINTGHTIGSHTINHLSLSKLNDELVLLAEIKLSAEILEKELGEKIKWFAYPFGKNEHINTLAYKIIFNTYHFCCTGLRGKIFTGSNPFTLNRQQIDLSMPLEYIKFILEGGLDFYYNRKRKVLSQLICKS